VQLGIRVVIADDHPALRESLRAALLATGNFEIAGEAATGKQALRLAIEQNPDIVVLDLHMPDLDGIAAAARILDRVPTCAVVMQSLSYSAPYVLKALGVGARGFIAKDDGIECLLRGIQIVEKGLRFLSPAVTAELRNTTLSMFSAESVRTLLSLFDREAPALLRGASTLTTDRLLARQALLESFLGYAIARMGSDSIPHPRAWLVLSMVSCLFSRAAVLPERPARKMSLSSKTNGAIHWYRSLFQRHANYGDLLCDWRGELPASATDRLRTHLRNCPSCYLEWCLVGLAQSSGRPDLHGVLQEVRKQFADLLGAADLGALAEAWSSRGRVVQRLMASELRVLLGSAAASSWMNAEDLPVAWMDEFLGSRARRASATMQTAMQAITGLGG